MDETRNAERWFYSTLCVLSTFVIRIFGFPFAGFGPCGPSHTTSLLFSGMLSFGAILVSLKLLSEEQRALRLRTIPFYGCIILASLFAGLQLFIGIS